MSGPLIALVLADYVLRSGAPGCAHFEPIEASDDDRIEASEGEEAKPGEDECL